MKFDYKPKAFEMGSPVFKRIVHVTLGFSAFVCLAAAISFGKSIPPTSPEILALPVVTSIIPSKIAPSPENSAKPNVLPTTLPISALSKITPAPKVKETKIPSDTWHTVKVREGDTLSRIFTKLGISTKDLHTIMTTDPASKPLASLQPRQTLKLYVSKEQQIEKLILDIAPGDTIQILRKAEGFQVEHKLQPLEKQLAFGKGAIQDSLFLAAKRAGLDYHVTTQMVEIFGRSIDFALDLQPSDTFRVLYEEKFLDGKKIETGNILAAEIVTKDKKHQAVRYTDKSGQTSYFSPDGYGLQQGGFLRTPVHFTRISSQFGLRKHPVLHRLRQHKGIDYCAPHGTPVQAIGEGKIVFMGTRGGYGKVVELQHGSRYTTRYAHLSRFPKGLSTGKVVSQGQVIGFVGRTGLATGPHLHYEFLVDGIHCNPLTVALPKKNPIAQQNKRHFLAHAKEMLRLLDAHDQKIKVAANDFLISHE